MEQLTEEKKEKDGFPNKDVCDLLRDLILQMKKVEDLLLKIWKGK